MNRVVIASVVALVGAVTPAQAQTASLAGLVPSLLPEPTTGAFVAAAVCLLLVIAAQTKHER